MMRTQYNASVDGSFESLPFGDGYSVASGEDIDPRHFAMLDQDVNDNDHAMYREYSSMTGRWMSPDPYAGSYNFADPQSLNRYAYVMNNPMAFTDPTGRICAPVPGAPEYTILCGAAGKGIGAWLSTAIPYIGWGIDIGLTIDDLGKLFGWWGVPQFHGTLTPRPNTPNSGKNCNTNPASASQYAAATGEVGAMTSEFFSGLGPGNLTFGPDSATSLIMGQSGPVREVLHSYYVTGQTSGLYTFGGSGLMSAGFNPVAQFVGSFRWSISGGTLSLTNTTSFRSLTYDMGPQWQRGSFSTPMGNTHQTYNISVTCH